MRGEGYVEQTNTLRKSRRVATDCRLEFLGEDEVDGDAEMLDVSSTGCMARSERTMPPGFRMRVSLFLADGLDWPVRVDEAVVRWAGRRVRNRVSGHAPSATPAYSAVCHQASAGLVVFH